VNLHRMTPDRLLELVRRESSTPEMKKLPRRVNAPKADVSPPPQPSKSKEK
jgi:hypothetical protein